MHTISKTSNFHILNTLGEEFFFSLRYCSMNLACILVAYMLVGKVNGVLVEDLHFLHILCVVGICVDSYKT